LKYKVAPTKNFFRELKKNLFQPMRRVDVNRSEYLRETVEAKIRAEMARDAARRLDEILRRAGKVPTKEIVRWIREDREISGHLKTQRWNRSP